MKLLKVAFIFVAALTGLSYSYCYNNQDELNEYAPFCIQAAHNLTSSKIALSNDLCFEHLPAKIKKILVPGFTVPFISIKHYMKQFVKNIPYAPEQALKIRTQLGLFRLWQSESGLICVPDPKDVTSELDTWKMHVVLENNKDTRLIKLLLLVDRYGQIKLRSLKQ